jgi:ethanolamine utilization protein EutA
MRTALASREESPPEGGRIFFSGASRSLVEEDEIRLTSVGVDIGSSTAHMMLSRITLERLDTRYIVADRETLFTSDILLTPYLPDGDIDAAALGAFLEDAFAASGVARDAIDTGALILTGVAVRRRNARAIGTLFAKDAGKFVAVSAGDRLEALMAAHGSGAVVASQRGHTVLNIDVGGGTTKLSVCRGGEVIALTAVEAGARLVVTDDADRVIRLEEFGAATAAEIGATLALGSTCARRLRARMGLAMAARIGRAVAGIEDPRWLRLPSLPEGLHIDGVIFSGGVSEYIYGTAQDDFGDLGPSLAFALRDMAGALDLDVLPQTGGIRATVIGASQHTIQVSGSTVYLDPVETLPLRNLATIRPQLALADEVIDPVSVARAVRAALIQHDLSDGDAAVAVALDWQGSATYHRLDGLCRGLVAGMADILAQGHPLVLVADGDVGGLLGMHCRENDLLDNAIVAIDGIGLSDFDFIDIGEVILSTGSVPVVVKSLLFPGDAAQGKDVTHD